MRKNYEAVISDDRYIRNIEYGKPRSGHPEGKVKFHISELDEKLEKLRAKGISEEQYWKLKFIVHVHDTFKAEATPNSPIESLNSHSSLARKFAAEFTDDDDILNMIQFHDVNYSLWKQFEATGSYNKERFDKLLATIKDWEIFLMFIILDGTTSGKNPLPTSWFVKMVNQSIKTVVDETWIVLED